MTSFFSNSLSLGLMMLISTSSAFSQPIQFRGYVKELGSLAISNDLRTLKYDNILHNRIESTWDASDSFELKVDVRNRLLSGFTVRNTPFFSEFLDDDPSFLDMSWTPIESDDHLLHSTIDRAQLSYFNGPFEVTLGRQRINWGQTFVGVRMICSMHMHISILIMKNVPEPTLFPHNMPGALPRV